MAKAKYFSEGGEPRYTVAFRSTPAYYKLEESGAKPCTIRVLDTDDSRMEKATHVRIEDTKTTAYFTRKITWQGCVGELFGKTIMAYCWAPQQSLSAGELWLMSEGARLKKELGSMTCHNQRLQQRVESRDERLRKMNSTMDEFRPAFRRLFRTITPVGSDKRHVFEPGGRCSEFQQRVMAKHRKEWPELWEAIDEMIEAGRGR